MHQQLIVRLHRIARMHRRLLLKHYFFPIFMSIFGILFGVECLILRYPWQVNRKHSNATLNMTSNLDLTCDLHSDVSSVL